MKRDVLIVGAGIAGLTAARALLRDGHTVRIVERAPRFEAVGAGIVLAGNALAALDALGIGDRVREAGHLAPNGGVFALDGAPLAVIARDQLGGHPLALDSRAYYRPELHEVLADGLEAELHLGTAPREIVSLADGVDVQLQDGWSGRVDLVVGADGLGSQVREVALGDAAPAVRYAGYTCWRAIAPNPGIDAVSESWGRGERVGVVPLSNDRVYSFLVANEARGGSDDETRPVHEQLQERFAAFGGMAGEMVASLSPESQIMRHDIEELYDVVWGKSRLVLIGDAAHAMTPNMGQGAAMGIEDALALALVLREPATSIPERLRDLRDRRVRQIKDRSRMIGTIGQWQNVLACGIRNLGTKLTPASVTLNAIEVTLRPGAELARTLGVRRRD